VRSTPRSRSSGPTLRQDEIDDFVAQSMKAYRAEAGKALILLTKGRGDDRVIADRWCDVEIAKAIAVNEEANGSARLYEVVGLVDSWQHMVLRPDELADGVDRLVASGLIHRSKDRLTTSQRLKRMAPRREDGALLVGSAAAGRWRKIVLGSPTKPVGYRALFARATKTYEAVAQKALLLLSKMPPDGVPAANQWMDVEILKAIAVTKREGIFSTLDVVIAVVDSREHTILRPDELASGVSRLVAAGLVHRSKDRLSTTRRFNTMAPRKENGELLMGSAGDRKWRKLVFGSLQQKGP